MQLKFNLPPQDFIYFFTVNKTKFFVLQTDHIFYYIILPLNTSFEKKAFQIIFRFSDKNKNLILRYINFFTYWLRTIRKPLVKKLILKGLGLKAVLKTDSLELKLGFSHIISINLKEWRVQVFVRKNLLFIKGRSFVEMSTFLSMIRQLKIPNVYKGKGIWYKNETRVLKPIKKT